MCRNDKKLGVPILTLFVFFCSIDSVSHEIFILCHNFNFDENS